VWQGGFAIATGLEILWVHDYCDGLFRVVWIKASDRDCKNAYQRSNVVRMKTLSGWPETECRERSRRGFAPTPAIAGHAREMHSTAIVEIQRLAGVDGS